MPDRLRLNCSPCNIGEPPVAGLRAQGAELVGEVAQYEDSFRLCYVRGSEEIMVSLAEQLS